MDHEARMFFEVVAVRNVGTRPVLIPSSSADADRSLTTLSFEIQHLDIWRTDTAGEAHTMLFDSDTEWCTWNELAPFKVLLDSLLVWERRASDVFACIDIFNPQSGCPRLPLLDRKCPTILIWQELSRLGWKFHSNKCEHRSIANRALDGRSVTLRKKGYYQVLLNLPYHLTLTSYVPSDQPLLYYDLLLRGVAHEEWLCQCCCCIVACRFVWCCLSRIVSVFVRACSRRSVF